MNWHEKTTTKKKLTKENFKNRLKKKLAFTRNKHRSTAVD